MFNPLLRVYVKISLMTKAQIVKLIGFCGLAVLVILVAIGVWQMPPRSSEFVKGWTRAEYSDRFGDPSRKIVDRDEEGVHELWEYETRGAYFGVGDRFTYVIFEANSKVSTDIVHTTVGIAE